MSTLAQLLVTGIAMGFIYCMVAIEYTLVYNTTGLINFAHEKFITLGAYFFGGTMYLLFPDNFLLAILGTTVFMFFYGVAASKIILMPLSRMPFGIYAVTGTLMLSIIMREGIRLVWGPAPFTVPGFLVGTISVGGIVISVVNIYIIVISIILLIAQRFFFTRTKIGKSLTCVSENKEVAALMGINVNRSISISVGISAMLCGWIGMLVIPLFSINGSMASSIAMKGFSAGVVGGFGTMEGAIIGGLFIGILESVYLLVGPSTYKDVVAFVLLIIFLILNPGGFIGMMRKKDGKTSKENIFIKIRNYLFVRKEGGKQ